MFTWSEVASPTFLFLFVLVGVILIDRLFAWRDVRRAKHYLIASRPSLRTMHAANIDGIMAILVRRETDGEVFWNWSTRSPRCPDCSVRGMDVYLTPNGKRSVIANVHVAEWAGEAYVTCPTRPWRIWRVESFTPAAERPIYVNAGGVGGVTLEPETGSGTVEGAS